jgi:hypothetical protein
LTVVLADVAAGRAIGQFGAEFDAARNDRQLSRCDFQNAELGAQQQAALLGKDQHFAVGVVEEAVMHRRIGDVEVDAATVLHCRVAVAAEGDDSVDEVGWIGGQRQRIPAHLVGRRRDFSEGAAAQERVFCVLAIGLVHHRGADAVAPCAAVQQAGRGEGGAADLLGVKAEGRVLRSVLALRQCAEVRFRGKFIAKSGLILMLSHGEAPVRS